MRHILTLLLLVIIVAAEATLWTLNPMHIPAAFLPARALGVQMFKELGTSMEPGIPEGQNVIVSSWAYWHDSPRVGDIVAFAYPGDASVGDVKRIVAAGGSTVEIRQGVLYVDGARPDEPYLTAGQARTDRSMPKTTVPPGTYFVMGDKRDDSEDSRNYGPISSGRIIGRQWW
jgi:signal peptidase I